MWEQGWHATFVSLLVKTRDRHWEGSILSTAEGGWGNKQTKTTLIWEAIGSTLIVRLEKCCRE